MFQRIFDMPFSHSSIRNERTLTGAAQVILLNFITRIMTLAEDTNKTIAIDEKYMTFAIRQVRF